MNLKHFAWFEENFPLVNDVITISSINRALFEV